MIRPTAHSMTDHTLETVTGPDTLEQIQSTLDDAMSAADVSSEARIRIELAVSEIGSNIVKHARGGLPVHLRMAVTLETDSLVVTFTDDGMPVTVDLAHLEMPDVCAERHRGLAIAHAVLDDLTYRRDALGNHWTLTCRRIS